MDFLHTTHQGNLTKNGYNPSQKGSSQSDEGIQSLSIPLSILLKTSKGEKEEVVTLNSTENKANASASNSLIIPLTFIQGAMASSTSDASKDGIVTENKANASDSNSLVIPLTFIPGTMASSTSDARKDGMVNASHVETGIVDDDAHVPNENANVGAVNGGSDTLSVAIPLKFIRNRSKLKGTVNSDQVYTEQITEIPQSLVERPNVLSSQDSVITSKGTSSDGEPSDKASDPTGSHSSIDIPLGFLSSNEKNSGLQK